MIKQELTSLGELSVQLKVPKSKLTFYVSKGLLEPVAIVGRMYLFDKESSLRKIKEILKKQVKGLKLEEIKESLQ